MTSWWARWRLKSPSSWLFTQPFIQAQIKENIKAPRHWPLCGVFIGDRWILRTQRASNAESVSIWWRHHVNKLTKKHSNLLLLYPVFMLLYQKFLMIHVMFLKSQPHVLWIWKKICLQRISGRNFLPPRRNLRSMSWTWSWSWSWSYFISRSQRSGSCQGTAKNTHSAENSSQRTFMYGTYLSKGLSDHCV